MGTTLQLLRWETLVSSFTFLFLIYANLIQSVNLNLCLLSKYLLSLSWLYLLSSFCVISVVFLLIFLLLFFLLFYRQKMVHIAFIQSTIQSLYDDLLNFVSSFLLLPLLHTTAIPFALFYSLIGLLGVVFEHTKHTHISRLLFSFFCLEHSPLDTHLGLLPHLFLDFNQMSPVKLSLSTLF